MDKFIQFLENHLDPIKCGWSEDGKCPAYSFSLSGLGYKLSWSPHLVTPMKINPFTSSLACPY